MFAQAGGCVCLAQIACQLAWRQWANATSHRPNNAAEYILYVSACVGPPIVNRISAHDDNTRNVSFMLALMFNLC